MVAVLEKKTLVLNRHWSPITVTPVKEAICLVAKGAAYVVDPEDFQLHDLGSWADVSRARRIVEDRVVRSPSARMAAPEVIVLTKYEGMGERSVVFSRRNIFKRDRYTCQYCGAQPGPNELTIDHVVPRSRGGSSSWENCVLACLPCNARKANRTPAQARMRMRRRPRKPSWKALAAAPDRERLDSWEKFLSKAYWDVELES